MTISKKKISAKLIGDIKAMVAKGELRNGQAIYRAIGVVDGMRTGQSTYGEWVGFTGDFEMTDMLTGEVYQGSQFFPDASVTEAIVNKLKLVEGGTVEIALECCIDIDKTLPTGYAYVSRPIIENGANRLESLRQRMAALPAPEAPKSKKK